MDLVKQALISTKQFVKLALKDNIHRRKDRLGRVYHIPDKGDYRIFRETTNNAKNDDKPVIIIVGFRLKVLRQNMILHRLFQRACFFTTPFWSGFAGFKVKLWMVQPTTGNYLGIYEWAGKGNAQSYVQWLERVLRIFSIPNSIWHTIETTDFEKYLEAREYKLP